MSSLRGHLEEVIARTDVADRLAADPVAFPRRYSDPADREIAGLLASSLAYGRVDLFRPVLGRIFEVLDELGGPAAAVARFDPALHGAPLRPVVYRWNRGIDFVVLLAALREVIEEHGSIGDAFPWVSGNVRPTLEAGVAHLRAAAVRQAPRCGVEAADFASLPHGLRYLLPSPITGSACKRWCMYLRWMVRPDDGVDLGVWDHVPTRALVMPMDVHTLRISRFIGLTDRKDGSWRTAEEVTAALARLDPEDPVRFDFALAHLGISRRCLGHRDAEICPGCPLHPICTA